MNFDVLIPLLSALVGALIGSAGSVAVVMIQAKKDERKHVRDTAIQMALADRAEQIEIIKKRGGAIYPMSIFLAYHLELANLMSTNSITEEALKKLSAKMHALLEAADEIEKAASERDRQSP